MFEKYPDVLTVAELQEALGIGRSLAYRLVRDGCIRHVRVGRKILIPRRYLLEFVGVEWYNDDSHSNRVAVMRRQN